MKSKLLAALACVTGLAFASPIASAERGTQTFRVSFAYKSTESADQIYRRLSQTAYRACAENMSRSPIALRLISECARDVVEAGVVAMKRNDVTALHNVYRPGSFALRT
jgi:UrcA family protein